eukprot:ANDGO_03517.mRNA.1 hypothetical protein
MADDFADDSPYIFSDADLHLLTLFDLSYRNFAAEYIAVCELLRTSRPEDAEQHAVQLLAVYGEFADTCVRVSKNIIVNTRKDIRSAKDEYGIRCPENVFLQDGICVVTNSPSCSRFLRRCQLPLAVVCEYRGMVCFCYALCSSKEQSAFSIYQRSFFDASAKSPGCREMLLQKCATDLESLFSNESMDNVDFSSHVHGRGLRMRDLPLLYGLLRSDHIKCLLIVEIVARCCRKHLRQAWISTPYDTETVLVSALNSLLFDDSWPDFVQSSHMWTSLPRFPEKKDVPSLFIIWRLCQFGMFSISESCRERMVLQIDPLTIEDIVDFPVCLKRSDHCRMVVAEHLMLQRDFIDVQDRFAHWMQILGHSMFSIRSDDRNIEALLTAGVSFFELGKSPLLQGLSELHILPDGLSDACLPSMFFFGREYEPERRMSLSLRHIFFALRLIETIEDFRNFGEWEGGSYLSDAKIMALRRRCIAILSCITVCIGLSTLLEMQGSTASPVISWDREDEDESDSLEENLDVNDDVAEASDLPVLIQRLVAFVHLHSDDKVVLSNLIHSVSELQKRFDVKCEWIFDAYMRWPARDVLPDSLDASLASLLSCVASSDCFHTKELFRHLNPRWLFCICCRPYVSLCTPLSEEVYSLESLLAVKRFLYLDDVSSLKTRTLSYFYDLFSLCDRQISTNILRRKNYEQVLDEMVLQARVVARVLFSIDNEDVHLDLSDNSFLSPAECECLLRWCLLKKSRLSHLTESEQNEVQAMIAEHLKFVCTPHILSSYDPCLVLSCSILYAQARYAMKDDEHSHTRLSSALNVLGFVLRIIRSRTTSTKRLRKLSFGELSSAGGLLYDKHFGTSVMSVDAGSCADSESPESLYIGHTALRNSGVSRIVRLVSPGRRSTKPSLLPHHPGTSPDLFSVFRNLVSSKAFPQNMKLNEESMVAALEIEASILHSHLGREFAHRFERKDWVPYVTRLQESVLTVTQCLGKSSYRSADCITQACKSLSLLASEAYEHVFGFSLKASSKRSAQSLSSLPPMSTFHRSDHKETKLFSEETLFEKIGQLKVVCDSAEFLEYLWPLFDVSQENLLTRNLVSDMVSRTRVFCVQSSLALVSLIADDERSFSTVWSAFSESTTESDDATESEADSTVGGTNRHMHVRRLSLELKSKTGVESDFPQMQIPQNDKISFLFDKIANRIENFLNRLSEQEVAMKSQVDEYRGDLAIVRARRLHFLDQRMAFVTNERKNEIEKQIVTALQCFFASDSLTARNKVKLSRDFLLSHVGLLPRVFKWGILRKRGAIWKNWKPRCFALYRERFAYFKTESDMLNGSSTLREVFYSDIIGIDDLTDQVRIDESIVLPSGTTDSQVIVVRTTSRVFIIIADNELERTSWLDAFLERLSAFSALKRAGVPL